MKESFRTTRMSQATMDTIDTVNTILEEYDEQGYTLTLRQLYYQLVAGNVIANQQSEYAKLGRIVVAGRMNGMIDWDMIEDRTRKPYRPYYVRSIGDALQDTVDQYRLDRQKDQSNHIEIWTEKDAVSNVLKRVSEHFHTHLMVNRGWSSCSAMYEAYGRMRYGDSSILIYVGDHDPSGLKMLDDMTKRLTEFGLECFELIPVALTMGQIRELKPPPNPVKTTDSNSRWYIEQFGKESWELDALKPEMLHDIVKKAVLKHLDEDKFDIMVSQEDEDKKKLEEVIQDSE